MRAHVTAAAAILLTLAAVLGLSVRPTAAGGRLRKATPDDEAYLLINTDVSPVDSAFGQLLRYRESLENPPLLVVCDMNRFRVHTNFTAAVNRTHEIPLEGLPEPDNLEVLRSVFHEPRRLKPEVTVAGVTKGVDPRLDSLRGYRAFKKLLLPIGLAKDE